MNQFFKEFKNGQKSFIESLSSLFNSIFLSIVFVLGVGVVSCILKLKHKIFLDTKIEADSRSYWSKLDLEGKKIKEYYRQF